MDQLKPFPKFPVELHVDGEPPGANFISILRTAFTSKESQKRKKDSQVVSLFALLGSGYKKLLVKC